MSELKGAMIIGQSGGPTAVINASAYGAIKASLDSDCITKVYGAAHGIVGVLNDNLYVMDEEDPAGWSCFSTLPPPPWAAAATKLRTRTWMTPITKNPRHFPKVRRPLFLLQRR